MASKTSGSAWEFLASDGEIAARMRAFDWTGSPLGEPATWPAPLRAMCRTALATRRPVIIFWGPQRACLYNDAFASSLGGEMHPASLGLAAGDACLDAWHIVGKDIQGILDGGPPSWQEDHLVPVRRRGRIEDVYWTYSCAPIHDASSPRGVGGVVVLCVETTSTREAISIGEQQLRLATEAGGVGLWDVDCVENTLYWQPAVRHMFGIYSDRPVSMLDDFFEGLHPDDRERVTADYARATDPRMRAVYESEYRTIGKEDGLIRWVAARGRALFDDSGRCLRVLGTAIDVTRRKSDEARLRELNEALGRELSGYLAERKLLADIVEGTDVFIQVADLEFRWLAINRASRDEFEKIFGVRPSVGESMLELLAPWPRSREVVQAVWSRALAGETFSEVAEFGNPSHARRWYEMHYQPLYDSAHRRIGAYQFVYDVTDRLEAEERLARTEAALNQARKMEAIGLLTGGIAHDFNNLLQAVSTKFELIRRRPDAPHLVQGWAGDGVDVARRGARLTAQLMTFSRQREPDIRPVAMPAVLAGVADLLRTTLGPAVRMRIDADDVSASADATQLEMAVLNLAINARDAMPGGGEFVLAVREAAGSEIGLAGAFVELEVRDTGTGMSKDVMAKAFEPFFTTKVAGKGSGLGLSQVYGMAQRAGGTVRIDSDGMSWTAVRIYLPKASTEAAASAHPPAAGAKDDGPARLAVLVVDDDDAVRTGLVNSLELLGHDVLQAAHGEAALAVLDDHEADVMLVDFAMPGMNGATLVHLARARRPTLPVVFMSGHSDDAALAEALGQGALMLRKPFELDALRRALISSVRP